MSEYPAPPRGVRKEQPPRVRARPLHRNLATTTQVCSGRCRPSPFGIQGQLPGSRCRPKVPVNWGLTRLYRGRAGESPSPPWTRVNLRRAAMLSVRLGSPRCWCRWPDLASPGVRAGIQEVESPGRRCSLTAEVRRIAPARRRVAARWRIQFQCLGHHEFTVLTLLSRKSPTLPPTCFHLPSFS